MEAQLPDMFPSYDDRIELIRPLAQTIIDATTADKFPVQEVLDLGIPLIYEEQPKDLYSPQQRELQKWLQDKKKNLPNLRNVPGPVKLAGASIVAIAYSTGSMGIGASSPEIQQYDESAFGSGVGSYSII